MWNELVCCGLLAPGVPPLRVYRCVRWRSAARVQRGKGVQIVRCGAAVEVLGVGTGLVVVVVVVVVVSCGCRSTCVSNVLRMCL